MTHSFFTQRLTQKLLPLFLWALLSLGTTLACSAATLTVTNTADSGTGSLRQAISDANSGDTITFDPSVTGTISLTGGELAISQNLTLTGPGANVLAIDAGGTSSVFDISSGTVTISGLTLKNGNAGGGFSGGVYNNGTLTLTDCTLSGNSAPGGGGVWNDNIATLTNCTLAGNSAPDGGFGGGVYNNGTLTLTDCTLSGNSATGGFGGGVYNDHGTLTLTACLFSGSTGGDLYNYNNAAVTSGGSNLLGDGNGNGITGGVNYDQTGVSAGTANLAALASNGGPTQTCAVQAGSPAIGGDYALATSLDQRGYARIATQHTIGAYEANAFLPVTSLAITPSPVSLAVGTPQALTLTATYSDSSTMTVTAQANYLSINPTVATVDSTGTVTPLAPGLSLITAAFGGLTATANVTVTDPNAATACNALWTRTDSEFSLWQFPAGGFADHNFDPIPGYTAQALAMTPDGHAHFLLTAADGTALLDDALVPSLTTDHNAGTQTSLGPFPNWTPLALAAGNDGTLHLLWSGTGSLGSMALWTLPAGGPVTHQEYGPYPNWTPLTLSVAPDNTPRVLWTNTDGQVSFWVVGPHGGFQHFEFGPYPGWTPSALATGPDGLNRLTWNHAGDGLTALWTLTDAGRFVPVALGSYSGWSLSSLAVGGDDTLHMGWDGAAGEMSLWSLPDTDLLAYTHAEYGPFTETGWSLKALSAIP